MPGEGFYMIAHGYLCLMLVFYYYYLPAVLVRSFWILGVCFILLWYLVLGRWFVYRHVHGLYKMTKLYSKA